MKLLLAALVSVAVAIQPWMNVKDDPEDRATKLLAQMTLDEKIIMLHGSSGPYVGNVPANTRLNIPPLNLNDGPQGFRDNAHPGTTTSWPSMMTVAASWDEEAMMAYGTAMGKEFNQKGANVQLGPGACVARVPRNGRNFEYVSGEDPFLGYKLVQPVVKGIQGQGVIANAKHYVNNNQETNRNSVSENVDERTQFEIYYPPFEGAIEAGVGSFMCSYNKIRDTWSCENNQTLGVDLKQRLLNGSRAWVMSDWGATHSTSINAGLDQEMPSDKYMGDALKSMVLSGQVTNDTIDNSMLNILVPMFTFGLFDNPITGNLTNNVTSEAHNAVARVLSSSSHILLQNRENVLPLSKDIKTIVVVGAQGDASTTVHGGGSGQVVAPYVITPLQGVRNALGLTPAPAPAKTTCDKAQRFDNTDFYQPGNPGVDASSPDDCCSKCYSDASCNVWTFDGSTCWLKPNANGKDTKQGLTSGILASPGPSKDCNDNGQCVYYTDGSNATEVIELVAKADVAIVAVSTTSHEGADRDDLSFGNGQDELISLVGAYASKTVVAATCPGAVLMPWKNDVDAIVMSFMGGQELGNAMADVLFGGVNPSGRLPLTMPNVEDEVGFTQRQWPGLDNGEQAYYDEKLLVGYRWYDYHNIEPNFPFGHGLSYTNFTYSNIQASSTSVSVSIKNSGSVDGAEVAQLYLGFPDSAGEPPKQLKGFSKVMIASGNETTVTFPLRSRDKSIWDVSTHAWSEVTGTFQVYVGASSRDIRQQATFSN